MDYRLLSVFTPLDFLRVFNKLPLSAPKTYINDLFLIMSMSDSLSGCGTVRNKEPV